MSKNAVGESFSLSLFQCIEKIWMRGWGECQDFSSKILCLTVPKNFAGQPFRVSPILGNRKFLCFTGLCHDISPNICLAVPKNFAGEPFCAVFRNISGSE